MIRIHKDKGYLVALEIGRSVGIRLQFQYFGYDGHKIKAIEIGIWGGNPLRTNWHRYWSKVLSECSFNRIGDCDCAGKPEPQLY